MFFLNFILVILISDLVINANGAVVVTIYEHTNYQGRSREINLEPSNCFPLFDFWAKEISSVKLDTGVCLELYTNPKCDGRPRVLRGGADKDVEANLFYLSMNDAALSLKLCN